MPQHVRRIIEQQAEDVGFAALKRAATAMSEAYRDVGQDGILRRVGNPPGAPGTNRRAA